MLNSARMLPAMGTASAQDLVLRCERGRVVDRGRRAVSSMRSDGGGKAVDG